MRRPVPWRRLAALAALLFAWIGAQTANDVHGVLEDHVVCEEHSQIEDVPRVGKASHPEPSGYHAALPAPDPHHLCAFAGLVRTGLPGPTLGPAAPATPLASVPTALPPARASPVSPLRYAPKTSPPQRT